MTDRSLEDRKPLNLKDLAGWLLIDKASGPTSRDALNKLQWRWKKLKVGHAGTLDPLATGLLLVAVGTATRLVEITHRLDKSYEARIRLGAISPTDDADGDFAVSNSLDLQLVHAREVGNLFERQRGVFHQPNGCCLRH